MEGKSLAIVLLLIVLVGVVIAGVFLVVNSNHENNELKTENYSLETEVDNLETENDGLESELNQTLAELADIQELYPLKDFPTKRALQDWVDDNLRPSSYTEDGQFNAACEMVELGMEDGYWIGINTVYSEDYGRYLACCSAFANDQFYIFLPDVEVDDLISPGFFHKWD